MEKNNTLNYILSKLDDAINEINAEIVNVNNKGELSIHINKKCCDNDLYDISIIAYCKNKESVLNYDNPLFEAKIRDIDTIIRDLLKFNISVELMVDYIETERIKFCPRLYVYEYKIFYANLTVQTV